MDQLMPGVLRFDRFTLDLRRGSLFEGQQEIELRPKAFKVLCHLLQNDRRLVSKQELFDVVWPGVIVSEDSLAQCIRELRSKLSDHDHRLIKTLPRRGYLLDVPVTTHPVRPSADVAADTLAVKPWRRSRLLYSGASVFLCLAIAATGLWASWPRFPRANELFTIADLSHVETIAADKEIPLPEFRISQIERDVPDSMRRFVGVWVSTTGFINSHRQFMVVVTDVDKEGFVTGFTARGPPQPLSVVRSSARYSVFRARIRGNAFYWGDPGHEEVASLDVQNQLTFTQALPSGGAVYAELEPVWMLAKSEHLAQAQRAP